MTAERWTPMTPAEYRRMRLADMQQHTWRTARDLTNGNAITPAGTLVTIEGKRGGLMLCTERCAACGVRVFVRRCSPSDVERRLGDLHEPRYSLYDRGRNPTTGRRVSKGCRVSCSCGRLDQRVNEGLAGARQIFKTHKEQP